MSTVRLDPPAELSMSLGEAIFTQRAIRKLRPDPISDEALKLLLDAASKAPNSGNEQAARFLVLRDRERIQEFGKLYHEGWWAKRADEGFGPDNLPRENKRYKAPMQLADEMKDAPVVVLACCTAGRGSSVFPAVQNLLLAARALGIGSTLTTLHPKVAGRVREMFKIPEGIEVHCCIPLGYPRGRFGPTGRRPTAETTYYNEWNNRPPWR